MTGPSRADLDARLTVLRFEFSCPGEDLAQLEQALRQRATLRRRAMVFMAVLILVATLVLRRASLRSIDAFLYGVIALMLAVGFDTCKRYERAADEVAWLRRRLDELS